MTILLTIGIGALVVVAYAYLSGTFVWEAAARGIAFVVGTGLGGVVIAIVLAAAFRVDALRS